jgi:hypothetical protein
MRPLTSAICFVPLPRNWSKRSRMVPDAGRRRRIDQPRNLKSRICVSLICNLRGRYSALKGPQIAKRSGRIARNFGAPEGCVCWLFL